MCHDDRVAGKRELNELVVASGYDRLDVLPADFSYRHFDVLILDCPSGISLLSENVLRAADAVVVPLIPTPLSVRMLVQLRDFLVANAWIDMTLLPFFSMVDRRKALHHEVIGSTRIQFPGMLKTEVPYWSEIERMTLRRAPLPAYAPRSEAANVYATLWSEVLVKLKQAAFTRAVPISLTSPVDRTTPPPAPTPMAGREAVAGAS